MMEPEKLMEQPITDVVLIVPDDQLRQATQVIEHIGCTITHISGEEYRITFPQGSVEETYAGQSTQWTRRTVIRLPDGTTINKSIKYAINESQIERVVLSFPKQEPS